MIPRMRGPHKDTMIAPHETVGGWDTSHCGPPVATLHDRFRFQNSGIDCKQALYRAESSMGRHYHGHTTIVFTLSGSFTHTMRSQATTVAPHGLIYVPAGETHADNFGSGGARCFITDVDATWVSKRLAGTSKRAEEPRIASGGYLHSLVLRMYEEFKRPDSLSDLIVEGAFLELLGRWFREGDREHRDAPAWLRSVKTLLQDSFRESISLQNLSQVAGVHSSHVAREFHRVYDLTVGEYIRKLRVEFVAEKLRNPGKEAASLTDLALLAGFSSHAHMSWMFKRATGMTPSQYRKAHEITSIR